MRRQLDEKERLLKDRLQKDVNFKVKQLQDQMKRNEEVNNKLKQRVCQLSELSIDQPVPYVKYLHECKEEKEAVREYRRGYEELCTVRKLLDESIGGNLTPNAEGDLVVLKEMLGVCPKDLHLVYSIQGK